MFAGTARSKAAAAAGKSLRAVRELAGLTIAQVAGMANRSPGYLSQVENGKAPNVSEKYIANVMSDLSHYIVNPSMSYSPRDD